MDIEKIVSDILINEGSDGHCDGSERIAQFIEALLQGNAKDWEKEYFEIFERHLTK